MENNRLPETFKLFLKKRGWNLFKFQKVFLKSLKTEEFNQFLISSDTGSGKTITLFLPTLIQALEGKTKRIIYISPLRSIISDLFDTLKTIITELKLNINISKRTSDETSIIKKKQIENPSEIILTTPESVALMIAKKETDLIFKNISYFAIDELNEIINSKRGDQLVLVISHILKINEKVKIFSCSSNIENFRYLSNWLSFKSRTKIIRNYKKKSLKLKILYLENIPNYGHGVDYALKEIHKIIKNKKTIIFVNTRAQAEILFKNLYLCFKDLKIGIYHSSLSKKVREETETKIKNDKINSVISTSSLEMGIDWKNIDKIINIGAPKSVNKIIQRTGRSNHQHDGISEAILIPTNKFEYLECLALKNLISNNEFDKINEKKGSKDVLCQHLLLISCNSSFSPESVYKSIVKTYPYKSLKREEFYQILQFVYNGGYVLKSYKDWAKLKKLKNGNYIVKNNSLKTNILINSGTIIDSSNVKIKTVKGKILGTVEDSFINTLKEQDYFIFAGMTLFCKKIKNDEILVEPRQRKSNKVPVYWGGTMQIKSNLSNEILKIFNNKQVCKLPSQIEEFLYLQKKKSDLPEKNKILIETFPYDNGEYVFFHTFLGKEANQTLSNILISYLNEKKILTLTYILNDYSFGLYFDKKTNLKIKDFQKFFNLNLKKINSLDTAIAKRIFKEISMISGLIRKNSLTTKFSNKTFVNSDIIFDTIRKYEPNHIILKITQEEIEKYFVHASQIINLKFVKFKHVKLDSQSEFSRALIMEKEKIRINSPL